ncbi:MAG: nucleotidyltransferase family protein [Candidatus Brocadiaceae bacterium]|nr:nucleotidyltransferase family protein [Candidatus Brocadiaceae bacterium]
MKPIPTNAVPNSTMQFLIRCLRAFLAAEGEPPFDGVIEEEVDWTSLFQLASWHKVLPLLYRSLQAAPGPVLSRLKAYVRSASGHSLLLTGELLRLLKRFEAQGIPAMPLKGPALASFLYGDMALRQSVDIDILVQEENYRSAKRLLLSLGYQPLYVLARRQEKVYLQYQCQEVFTLARGDTKITTGLHWGIMPVNLPFRLNLKGVWERCETVSLAGATVTARSPEDLLLFLCVHGSKHGWRCLQWLCDVARLVSRHTTMDWCLCMERAKTSGCQRALFLGLFLADDILGTPIPHEIKQKTQHDPLTARLAGQIKWRLFDGDLIVPGSWEMWLFHLQLMERVQDRISYCVHVLTTPGPADWSSLPLPDFLFPLYYALRPMRLAGRYGLMKAGNYIYNRCKAGNTTKEGRNSSPEEKDLTR